MKDIVFSFSNCINPKHSDLTISQIGIAGPIKWTYAFGDRDAEQERVEYNNKLNEALHNFEPVKDALNESPAGDLSKSKLEDICNRSGILFEDFERTFLALEETFSAASKKLNYKHGQQFPLTFKRRLYIDLIKMGFVTIYRKISIYMNRICYTFSSNTYVRRCNFIFSWHTYCFWLKVKR